MSGRVEQLHVAAVGGAAMAGIEEADAVASVGLIGDRYTNGTGYWQDTRVSRDLTLVEAEVVDELAAAPGELRRNVTTRGVRLSGLVGRTFWVGETLCRGMQLCEPCRHLEELTGKQLLRSLVHRGGLRAAILTSGTVRIGDAIEAVDERDGVGVLVLRGRRVLLGQRLARHGYGTWSFPGGKPQRGESPVECAIRELREETGVEAREGRVIAESIDGFRESGDVYRTRFVQVDDVSGDPRRCEPDKVDDWRWCRWESLPEPLFAPVASLVRSGYTPGAR